MVAVTTDPTRQGVVPADTLRTSGALLAAQQALSRLLAEAARQIGQDPAVVGLLVHLDQAPDNRLRAVELSRQLLFSPSHMSRTIDRAEAAGLVIRSADTHDRRASQVALTSAGRTIVERWAPTLEAIIDRVIRQTLLPDENDHLVELLHRITDAACQPCPNDGLPVPATATSDADRLA